MLFTVNAEEWNARYRGAGADPGGHLWVKLPPQVFRDVVTGLAPGTALDLATGDGRNAIWLARAGWSVTGVDFASEAVNLARAAAAAAGVSAHWLVEDVANWQPSGRFDLVTIVYLHLPPAALREVLARASTWVAPGGHLLVLGHDRDNVAAGAPGPKDLDILYTTELLGSAVGSGLILRSEQVTRDLAVDPESPGETHGRAVDTLLLARF